MFVVVSPQLKAYFSKLEIILSDLSAQSARLIRRQGSARPLTPLFVADSHRPNQGYLLCLGAREPFLCGAFGAGFSRCLASPDNRMNAAATQA